LAFVWILVVGVAGMAGALAAVTAWERRRARKLKAAGLALGLRPFDKERLAVPSVEIMRKRGRTIGAVIEGVWRGQPIMVFDLSYPAGKSSSHTTVFLFRLPQPSIPEFAAIRKNILLYTPTVDLPKVQAVPPSLKSHWLLYAPQGQWPLGEEITECLARNPEWSFEGRGSSLFIYRRAKRAPTDALSDWLDSALAEAQQFARRLPSVPPGTIVDDDEEPASRTRVFRFTASFRI
jgi:hypothetical protein